MLYTIPEFVSLNARFMDAVMRRWEMLLEHAIHLRNGGLSPEEADQAFDSVRASTVESDMESVASGTRLSDMAGRSR